MGDPLRHGTRLYSNERATTAFLPTSFRDEMGFSKGRPLKRCRGCKGFLGDKDHLEKLRSDPFSKIMKCAAGMAFIVYGGRGGL